MKNISIVRLKPSEWQTYKIIQLEALQKDPQAFGSSYKDWVNYSDEKWQERPKNKDTMIFIAKDDETPVGLLGVHIEDIDGEQVAHLWGMYVNAQYRGIGLGKRLLQHTLETVCTITHVKKAKLSVEYEPTPAQMLYRSLGFEAVGTKEHPLGDGKPHRLYMMEKLLEG